MALRYDTQGADEMVFFDITASAHGRASMIDVIERAADQCFMPLTVGGGIRSVDDMGQMLRSGADKISINSSAISNPELIRQGAEKYGSQCIVVSIDAKKVGPDRWGFLQRVGEKRLAWTRWNGLAEPASWERARSSSIPSTRTGPSKASTW